MTGALNKVQTFLRKREIKEVDFVSVDNVGQCWNYLCGNGIRLSNSDVSITMYNGMPGTRNRLKSINTVSGNSDERW